MCYEFGQFRLDVADRTLTQEGQVVQLRPKVFDTLLILVENRGRLVRKDELMGALWPDSFVEEQSLSQNIFLLRRALGEGGQPYIQTVPKSGYRFVGEVREVNAAVSPEQHNGQAGRSRTVVTVGLHTPPDEAVAVTTLEESHSRPGSGRRRRTLVLTVTVAAGVFVLAVVLLSRGREQSTQTPTVRTLAVLPFKDIPTNADRRLGFGVADIIITKLSRLRGLSVRPTSAVFKYAGTDYDALATGRELEVDAVLDGTVQQEGGRVRVSLRLITVEDGQTIWADIFDEPFEDVFKVEDSIAGRVAQSLGRSLSAEEQNSLARRPTASVAAYEAYARGVYFWNKRSIPDLEKSIAYFQEAVSKDTKFALAYAGLAYAYGSLASYTPDAELRRSSFEASKQNVRKAKELDPELPEAYAANFGVKYYYEADEAGAERELKRAIELNGEYAIAYLRYGLMLRNRGDLAGAAEQFRRVLELDPISYVGNIAACEVMLFAGRYEKAIGYCEKAIETEPALYMGRQHLACIYTAQGRYDEAIQVFEGLAKTYPDMKRFTSGDLGYVYAKAGRFDEARLMLNELSSLPDGPEKTFPLILIYAGLGDREAAVRVVEKSDLHAPGLLLALKYDPRLADLQRDPHVRHLIDKASRGGNKKPS